MLMNKNTTIGTLFVIFFVLSAAYFINASTDDFEEKTGGLHQIKHFGILANNPSEAAVQLDLIHHSKQNIVPKVRILPDNKVYKGENLVNDDTLGRYIVELLFTDTRIQEKLAKQLSTNNYKVTSNPDSFLQVVRIAYPPDDSQMIIYLGCTAKPQVNVNEENNKLLINLRR